VKTIAALSTGVSVFAVALFVFVGAAGPLFVSWHPNEWGRFHLFQPFSSDWSAAVWVGGSLDDRADIRLREDTHHCRSTYLGPVGIAYCGPYTPRGQDI
jgi:hypothetical protein